MDRDTTGAGDLSERALVLRLWREGEGNGAVWRCSVEDPRTKQRRGFPSLVELLPFLDLLTHGVESASLLDASQESQPGNPTSGNAAGGRAARVVPDGVGRPDSIQEET